MRADRRVVLGKVRGAKGVHGWVRIESFAGPMENLFAYPRWQLRCGGRWVEYRVLEGQRHGPGLIAWLAAENGEPLKDRDQAMTLFGASIAVFRSELEELPEGEYYWVDLEGLRVATVDGVELGVVERVFETGANDVLVVRGERQRLIPFVQGPVVEAVDLDAGLITVDWDADF